MNSGKLTTYHERRLPFSGDPLASVARLAAAGLHDEYVVYEDRGHWSVASGVLAEITVDRSGVSMRHTDTTFLPWDGPPLQNVHRLLNNLPIAGWRAYGWAAFELAYAKGGDVADLDDQRLLHLTVPHTEIRFGPTEVHLRSMDREVLGVVAKIACEVTADPGPKPDRVEVRGGGAEDYKSLVSIAVGDINAGKYRKVICSRIVPVEQQIDLVKTYVSGRRGNNPARSFLLHLGGIEAAGFSPETVVQVDTDGRVSTQPLAGTRALTKTLSKNRQLRAELLSDPKEIYEHAISVYAACEELRTICAQGSVGVKDFMEVKERGSVQHLASEVSGYLAQDLGPWDAFTALFPSVTASGIPKTAAYSSIRANEPGSRGLYSGAVLTVDADGSMDAALVLRAVYRQQGRTWLRAGAGIVGQSKPEREYEETCEKLESVSSFLVPAHDQPSNARAIQSSGQLK